MTLMSDWQLVVTDAEFDEWLTTRYLLSDWQLVVVDDVDEWLTARCLSSDWQLVVVDVVDEWLTARCLLSDWQLVVVDVVDEWLTARCLMSDWQLVVVDDVDEWLTARCRCYVGRLFISDKQIVFFHPHSSAIVLPLSQLNSLFFYDGVRCHFVHDGGRWNNVWYFLGRLLWVDLIKPVSNVRPPVCTSIRPQKVSSILMIFGIAACTVVQAVVNANSQSNGKVQISTPGAPKPLNAFRWNMEYIIVSRVWPHMQIHVALRQRGWSGRTREKTRVVVS